MIKINLLPPEIERKAAAQQRTILIAITVIAVLAVFIGIYFLRVARIMTLKGEYKTLEAELRKYDAELEKIRTMEAKKKELETKLAVIKELVESRLLYPKLMEFLTTDEFLVPGVWVTSVQMKNAGAKVSLALAMNARDNYALTDFLTNLEKSKKISKVVITGFGPGEWSGEKIRSFTISCEYDPAVKDG